MVSVGKKNLDAERFEILLRLTFYGGGGADGHERRRIDYAVRRGQPSQPRARWVGRQHLELKSHPRKCIRRKQPPSLPSPQRKGARCPPPCQTLCRTKSFSGLWRYSQTPSESWSKTKTNRTHRVKPQAT